MGHTESVNTFFKFFSIFYIVLTTLIYHFWRLKIKQFQLIDE